VWWRQCTATTRSTTSSMLLMWSCPSSSSCRGCRAGLERRQRYASTLHDHTYGIVRPLDAVRLCFLGTHPTPTTLVCPTQLNLENSTLAKVYKNKSVAEQNSVDLCWDLLMDNNFDELRAAIYRTGTSASVSLLSTPSWLLTYGQGSQGTSQQPGKGLF
jgi:hypothetical protein